MLLGAVALCGLTASADITWEQQDNRVFLWGQSGSANFIDLNGDGRLDILTTGTGSLDANQPDYTGAEQAGPWKDKPGVYSWQGRTSIYYNNGDGTWTPNIMTPVEDGTELVNKKTKTDRISSTARAIPFRKSAPNISSTGSTASRP